MFPHFFQIDIVRAQKVQIHELGLEESLEVGLPLAMRLLPDELEPALVVLALRVLFPGKLIDHHRQLAHPAPQNIRALFFLDDLKSLVSSGRLWLLVQQVAQRARSRGRVA